MRIYLPDDLLPHSSRFDWKQRKRWLYQWQRITRTHPQYRVIFWVTFAITFVLESPVAFWLAQRESDRLIALLVVAGLNIFSSFWMASIVPYLFTRSELKRLIESQLKEQPVA